jgi:hypothetical protein
LQFLQGADPALFSVRYQFSLGSDLYKPANRLLADQLASGSADGADQLRCHFDFTALARALLF